jgi:hypothetical protein
MPLALVILLAWFAVSLVVGPLVGLAMAADRREAPASTTRGARADAPSAAAGSPRSTALGAA